MSPILLSTAYFPPISWMAALVQSESALVEIHETYPKQTYRNRCHIATASGILSLSVPVKKVNGNHTKTNEIELDYARNWTSMHWRSVTTAYNKSPYFLFYSDVFAQVLSKKPKLLIELNHELISVLLSSLNLKSKLPENTIEYLHETNSTDLRSGFHAKKSTQAGIIADFPRYIQVFEEKHQFLPDLSILDLLFNIGPEAGQYLCNLKIDPIQATHEQQDIQS